MENTSKTAAIPKREVFYYRRRQQNRIYGELASFFAQEAENGLTKKRLAERLQCDPALITRWLSGPSNLTLDTISDLLLGLGAEMDHRIVRFVDRPFPNEIHPFIEAALSDTSPQRSEKQPNIKSGTSRANILEPVS